MGKRAVSAVIGIGIFLGLCFGGLLPFALGTTVVTGLAAWEWIRAYQGAQKVEVDAGDALRMPAWQNTLNVLLACMGVGFPLLVYLVQQRNGWNRKPPADSVDALGFIVPVVLFALLTRRAARTGKALAGIRKWYGAVGLVYIGLLISSLVRLRALSGPESSICGYVHYASAYVVPFGSATWGAWLMLLVAVCVWATDTGAYLVGKSLGKHKLAPTLSPGKTIEGSLGGLALALVAGALFGRWIQLPLQHGLAIGLIAGVMGQWGDLFESALKRELGLKDFGALMPGHGGALDRIDSLLFATPLAFCYLHFLAGY